MTRGQKIGLAIAAIIVVVAFGLWAVLRHPDPCAVNKGNCPAIIGLEKDATLWLTPRQPRPGDVYRVVRDGNVASATLISSYLSTRAPLTENAQSLDKSVAVNDSKGVKASVEILKSLVPGVSAELSRARSVSLDATGTQFQGITSRSEFLTWLQDTVDTKKRDNPDGDNLMAEIRHQILPSTADDRPSGERYVVTEVLRASTIKYLSSDRQTDKAGVDCETGKEDCKTINFGRDLDSNTGSTINLAKQPIVFWVKMYRIGAEPVHSTLIYDERRPGPIMIGQ